MKKENFDDKHPAISSVITVICTLLVCTLLGAGIGKLMVGDQKVTDEQMHRYMAMAHSIWWQGLKNTEIGDENVEIVSKNEIKITDYAGVGITVSFSVNSEGIEMIHNNRGTKNGAVYGFVLGVGLLLSVILAILASSD